MFSDRGTAIKPFKFRLLKVSNVEVLLHHRFQIRRRIEGRKVRKKWLKNHYKQILIERDEIPPDSKWRASDGLISGFMRRFSITNRLPTNDHVLSVDVRVGVIQAFHRGLIYGVQRSHPRRCKKYGRYSKPP